MKACKSSLQVLIILAVIIFMIYNVFLSKSKNGFLDDIKEREIKSLVIKKHINSNNHDVSILVFGSNDSLVVYNDWWEKISVGDSIIKPKGSLEIIIKNSKGINKFDYESKSGLDY